jgi:hypothetical protein
MKKAKIPGISWSLTEKVNVVNAICSDPRFSHGEVRAAVVMVLYFHNSHSGELYPSRPQVSEQACVSRDTVIAATRKMRRLGFLHYEDSDGGCNHRNTYYLRKLTVECSDGKPSSVPTPPVEPADARPSSQPTRNYPRKGITREEIPEALPLPRKGEASASVEKREEASSGAQVVKLHNKPHPPNEGASSTTEEERATNTAKLEELSRKLRGVAK